MNTSTEMSLFMHFAAVATQLQEAVDARKQSWLDEWEKSKNYPRKMKKRVRKELRLDWIMMSYNPFE